MTRKLVSDLCLSSESDPGLSLNNALKIYLNDLRASLRSKGTIESKRIVLQQLVDYAEENNWPGVPGITTNHLREYLGDLQERPRWFGKRGSGPISTSYYETIYRRIKTFFNWLIDEGEIPPPPGKRRAENPMDRIKHPRLEEKIVPTVPKDDLSTIMALADPACHRGTASKFRAFRNQAVLSLLADTPVRRGGLTSLKVDDVDLEERRVLVTEKGRKQRYGNQSQNW